MAILFTVLSSIPAIILLYFIIYFSNSNLLNIIDKTLQKNIDYIEKYQDFNYWTELPEKEVFLMNFSSSNVTSYESMRSITPANEELLNLIIENNPKDNEAFIMIRKSNAKAYGSKIHTFNNGLKLIISTEITELYKTFKQMNLLGLAGMGFLIILIIFSYMISVFVVSGTNQIANLAREIIETGDLSRRVNISSRWDDISNLAITLNIFLDRIQHLMIGIRQVTENISHDLRTPLTRIKNKIEFLNEKKKDRAFEELSQDCDGILDTFNALLRIARIETEKQRSQFSNLKINEILLDVISFYEPLAENKKIIILQDLKEFEFYGDRDLLFQAYANLVDNSIKFTPKNGSIFIKTFKKNKFLGVEISDSGPGVSESEKSKIFERFYRHDKSRSSAGIGLGLSLVNAVVSLHHGRLEVDNLDPGLKIITYF